MNITAPPDKHQTQTAANVSPIPPVARPHHPPTAPAPALGGMGHTLRRGQNRIVLPFRPLRPLRQRHGSTIHKTNGSTILLPLAKRWLDHRAPKSKTASASGRAGLAPCTADGGSVCLIRGTPLPPSPPSPFPVGLAERHGDGARPRRGAEHHPSFLANFKVSR